VQDVPAAPGPSFWYVADRRAAEPVVALVRLDHRAEHRALLGDLEEHACRGRRLVGERLAEAVVRARRVGSDRPRGRRVPAIRSMARWLTARRRAGRRRARPWSVRQPDKFSQTRSNRQDSGFQRDHWTSNQCHSDPL